MGQSGPWKRRHTGLNELNQRSDEFRHRSDSALISLHQRCDTRLGRMKTRLKLVLIILLLGVIGSVSLFRVVTWLAYIFVGVSVIAGFVGLHAIHIKEKCFTMLAVISVELKARGVNHRL
ncbi:MAG: hypothetical protein CMI52_05050 [Parcubacteria group bacterium]|nr:hypothetical protein [Parcubacteria group bacterium]|tara:strand:+ start:547 stop:906 length:360 start_codon:yes stop_codon:yes gene_type:complete